MSLCKNLRKNTFLFISVCGAVFLSESSVFANGSKSRLPGRSVSFSVCDRGPEGKCAESALINIDPFILGQQFVGPKSSEIATTIYFEISDDSYQKYKQMAAKSFDEGKVLILKSCAGEILSRWIITSKTSLSNRVQFSTEGSASNAISVNRMFCE